MLGDGSSDGGRDGQADRVSDLGDLVEDAARERLLLARVGVGDDEVGDCEEYCAVFGLALASVGEDGLLVWGEGGYEAGAGGRILFTVRVDWGQQHGPECCSPVGFVGVDCRHER